MITHQPTPKQLEGLQKAHLEASRTGSDVAEARAKLAQALAKDSEAQAKLSAAIADVLYGAHDDSTQQRTGNAYELSNDLAQQHWPTSPPGGRPGG